MVDSDELYLRTCFSLARKGRFFAPPNPLVGAVIVKNNIILATGYHREFGGDHAEIAALKKIQPAGARGATLYCNLEPCCHQGKTPPCAPAIIRAGIKKVVIANLDPHPAVNGGGAAILRTAGLKVRTGILEKEGQELNRHFFTAQQRRRPYVCLKAAASLDAKIALKNGESKWITSDEARSWARRRRDEFQSILVGIKTVEKDDPHLGGNRRDPLRIIIDPHLRIPPRAQVLRDQNCLICCQNPDPEKRRILKDSQIPLLVLPDLEPRRILSALFERQIISLLVEGGAYTLSKFISDRLADELDYYLEPILLGSEAVSPFSFPSPASLTTAPRLQNYRLRKLGSTFYLNGKLNFLA